MPGLQTLVFPRYGIQRPRWPFELNRDSPQADHLIGFWPIMPEASATDVLIDLAGLNELTLISITSSAWLTDIELMQVLDLDGAVDFASSTTVMALFDPSNPWSMAGWAELDDLDGNQKLLSLVDESGSEHVSRGASNTEVKISSDAKTPGTGLTLSSGRKYLFVMTWDGTELKAYIDGVLDYSVTPSPDITWADLDAMYIGASILSGARNAELNGKITNILLYDYELPAAVIWQMWDPSTRWDLYYEPNRVFYSLKAPVAPGGIAVLRRRSEGY